MCKSYQSTTRLGINAVFHSKRLWWDLTLKKCNKWLGNYLIKDLINRRKLEVPGPAGPWGFYTDLKKCKFVEFEMIFISQFFLLRIASSRPSIQWIGFSVNLCRAHFTHKFHVVHKNVGLYKLYWYDRGDTIDIHSALKFEEKLQFWETALLFA